MLAIARGRCPKWAVPLVAMPFRGIEIDKCSGCAGDWLDTHELERRIAQLRPGSESYQLYWKKGNGRWTAYYDDRGEAFAGSLADCLREISRDPFSCYWS